MKKAAPPLIYFIAVVIALLLQFYFPVFIFKPALWSYAISAFLFISSSSLICWALVSMLAVKTSPNPYKEARNLAVTGPYHYSRNPMYVAMTGMYLALAFLLDNFWLFLLLIPLLKVINIVILREEAYLESRFAAQYDAYKKRVRRWF